MEQSVEIMRHIKKDVKPQTVHVFLVFHVALYKVVPKTVTAALESVRTETAGHQKR